MNEFVKARLREPSTWRGLFAFVAAIGIQVAPGLQDAIVQLALLFMGAGGLLPDAPGVPQQPMPSGNLPDPGASGRGSYDDMAGDH